MRLLPALTSDSANSEVARLYELQVSALVTAGIPRETATMACNRAVGNAKHAALGLPDELHDEMFVAKARYELGLTEGWARRVIDRITE